MRLVLLLLAVPMFSGCLAEVFEVGEQGNPLIPRDWSYSAAGCEEIAVIVPIPADKARDAVPAQYELFMDQSGRALVTIATVRCEEFNFTDGALPLAHSDVGVMIEDPMGNGDMAFYQLWMFVESPAVFGRLLSTGFMGWQADSNWNETNLADELLMATRSAHWAVSETGYAVQVDTAGPLVANDMGTVWWYHDGLFGTSKISYQFPGLAMTTGIGSVEATGLLAEVLENSSGETLGLRMQFDMDVNWEFDYEF